MCVRSFFWQHSIFHIKGTVRHDTFLKLSPSSSSRIVLNFSLSHFCGFISNYEFHVLFFSYSKIWFFSGSIFASKAVRREERKKSFVCPLNRFLLGRIINNKMFFEWREKKRHSTHTDTDWQTIDWARDRKQMSVWEWIRTKFFMNFYSHEDTL